VVVKASFRDALSDELSVVVVTRQLNLHTDEGC